MRPRHRLLVVSFIFFHFRSPTELFSANAWRGHLTILADLQFACNTALLLAAVLLRSERNSFESHKRSSHAVPQAAKSLPDDGSFGAK